MDDNKNIILNKIPEESDTIEESLVKLKRGWGFWENYEAKSTNQKLKYDESLKKIFSFDDIITFWQFWNKYPGTTPSNIFFNGERIR